ncbi:hypothetical protein LEP1GSC058_0089 [Leptospira fainei serovar Hurstbridge str. BUT 6]|uniref:Uncharacterized protein n=1 Tax=Leptospira fainei serovar Hurstbridge str. BUT 6 TaxID=1193011 RepID=S3V3I0_9LEPT|nr:hypothetical protein LEP1GSC058_0089 [Leptospira fainei serovar Hurstbridge str. BUT 6]
MVIGGLKLFKINSEYGSANSNSLGLFLFHFGSLLRRIIS